MNTKQSYFWDASKIKKKSSDIILATTHCIFLLSIPGFNEFSRLYVLDSHADRYFLKLLKKKERKCLCFSSRTEGKWVFRRDSKVVSPVIISTCLLSLQAAYFPYMLQCATLARLCHKRETEGEASKGH